MMLQTHWFPKSFALAIGLWALFFILFSFWSITPWGMDPETLSSGKGPVEGALIEWVCPSRNGGYHYCDRDQAILSFWITLPVKLILLPIVIILFPVLSHANQWWGDQVFVNPYYGVAILYGILAYFEFLSIKKKKLAVQK